MVMVSFLLLLLISIENEEVRIIAPKQTVESRNIFFMILLFCALHTVMKTTESGVPYFAPGLLEERLF
jgi:hypothetical protein